jgi:N-acetylglucosaminyldiphosphoundecaprenol N-acetyl-beta-D-mannosaminyltransferase
MPPYPKRITILNTPVDALSMENTLRIIDDSIKNKQTIKHVVVNAAKLVNMQKDKKLFDSVVSSDIINADGQSIIYAAKLLNKKLPERVSGIDLMEKLVELAYLRKYRIFFFGAKEAVLKKVISFYSKKYSPNIIAGFRNGYFSASDEMDIVNEISFSNPDILFVAISSPKKEIFLNKYKNNLNVPFVMGVGGSFDVIAGITKRAPYWMQKIGLEWFFRFLQEPRRMWKRYLITNILFIYYIIKNKFSL